MPARMTPTAWGRGTANALICGFIFFACWLLVAVLISSVSHRSLSDSSWLAFAILWGLIFLLFLGTWLYGLNAGGRVLLDCGPHPTRVLFLFNAALFLVMGLTGGLVVGSLSNCCSCQSRVWHFVWGLFPDHGFWSAPDSGGWDLAVLGIAAVGEDRVSPMEW